MTQPPAGSTILIPTLPTSYANAVQTSLLFPAAERDRLFNFEKREQPEFSKPGESCKTNLFIGFFFDGTKNNYHDAEIAKNHSNVARLYDCYPGLSVPGVLDKRFDWKYKPEQYSNFFRIYIPGVASKFVAVGDTGEGWQEAAGGAVGKYGEHRIIWAMIQAINSVHRFFLKATLISSREVFTLVGELTLDNKRRQATSPTKVSTRIWYWGREMFATNKALQDLLTRLHVAIKDFIPGDQGGKPKNVGPGMVKTIHISTFGFSRGSAQARAFQNWMVTMCQADAKLSKSAHPMTLGGFPVVFDFLGLFDTVASIGAGNTLGDVKAFSELDGHSAWADTENSLRIPHGIPCVHLMAAHELRRSFPVDSISVRGVLPPNAWEIVVPGVHSDVGCGYSPKEQGKGTDDSGADMLSRIPLVLMYRMARLSGVPLKLEFAAPTAQSRFAISPSTIDALNNYTALCKVKSGTLTTIMREQARLQMEWRLSRRATGPAPIETAAFFQRCNMLDKNDFYSANLEFEKEIDLFEAWRKDRGKNFTPQPQDPGFDKEHKNEWEEIATWYHPNPTPPAAVMTMFDEYVHDSRSWFKIMPGEPDTEEKVHELLRKWAKTRKTYLRLCEETVKLKAANGGIDPRMVKREAIFYLPENKYEQKAAEAKAADEYLASGSKVIPHMITTGREPWALRAGYLRYRKIYSGFDTVLLSSNSETKAVSEGNVPLPAFRTEDIKKG